MLTFPSPIMTNLGSLPALCTPAELDTTADAAIRNEDDVQAERGGLSWLTSTATGGQSQGRTTCPDTAMLHDDGDDDALGAALSGRLVATTTRNAVASSPPSGAGRVLADKRWPDNVNDAPAGAARGKRPSGTSPPRSGGGGWLVAGKMGLSADDSDDNDTKLTDSSGVGGTASQTTPGKNAMKSAKKKRGEGGGPEMVAPLGGASGWLTAAVATGQLGVPGDDDEDKGGDTNPSDEGHSPGVTVETQTDENIEQAIKESTKPSLPPWAKPWTSPPAAAAGSVEEVAIAEGTICDGRRQGDAKSGSPISPTAAGIDWVEGATQGRNLTSTMKWKTHFNHR